jgi:hypothetical protein
MASCPNQRHSVILKEMCDRMRLVDPFRFLYPNERNYSYIPRNALANNRSRIDFFIISHSLINSVEKCYISEHLQSTMFDHKPVFLQLIGKIRQRRSPTICNKILRDPDIELIVDLSVKETYLIYQERPVENKRALLAGIGTNVGRIREAGLNKSFYRLVDLDPADELRRQQLLTLINDFRSSADFLSIVDYPVNINDDLFFEMLLNNIRNDIIGYQCYVFREKSLSKKILLERLHELRSENVLNFDLIFNLERQLQQISEMEIEAALETHPLFEPLNGEKMSPNFLKLVKKQCLSSIDVICREDIPFSNNSDREDYIVSYFRNIYAVPDAAPQDFTGLIENFLGPEICNNDIVLGSKLTIEEAAALDSDLTFQELDEAVSGCKIRTAPGRDGFSNAFIKKILAFFQVPLVKLW